MRCKTGKRKYNTPADALLALQRIHHQRDIDELDKYERAYYPCDECPYFHLTSWKSEEG